MHNQGHITRLEIENIKRVKAVTITPDGNIVPVKGKCRNGKTSVLDSIWYALAGTSVISPVPIRMGEESASIKVSIGTLRIHRTFKKTDDGTTTTKLKVMSADGAEYKSPQTMLDRLLDHLAFDPMEFAAAKASVQFDMLKKFVPGVDFGKLATERALDFSKRTEASRRAADAKSAAEAIIVPDGTPAEPIDVAEILAKVAEANKHNADIAERKSNRVRGAETVAQLREQAAADSKRLSTTLNQIDDLKARDESGILATYEEDLKIAAAKRDRNIITANERHSRAMAEIDLKLLEAGSQLAKADEIEARMVAAGDLPFPIDVSQLLAQANAATETNKAVSLLKTKATHLQRHLEAKAQAAALTASIEARDAAKTAAIEQASFPVAGLGLGDGIVTYRGVPFEQASGADQIEVSLAIAMAGNPEMKVVRIKHGNDLDKEALAVVTKMATEKGFQVWMEVVADENDGTGFYIEDGNLVGVPAGTGIGGGAGSGDASASAGIVAGNGGGVVDPDAIATASPEHLGSAPADVG